MSKKISKKNIARLEKMLYALDLHEAKMQFGYGDRVKGSLRQSRFLDAEALRTALVFLKSPA